MEKEKSIEEQCLDAVIVFFTHCTVNEKTKKMLIALAESQQTHDDELTIKKDDGRKLTDV